MKADLFSPSLSPAETDRFWSRVNRRGRECWPWMGGESGRAGYGKASFSGRAFLAHRVAFAIANGPFQRSLCVCHRCDNPPCCNPEHLFLGTDYDNVQDRVRKGRSAHQDGIKITNLEVIALRNEFSEGARQGALAVKYGVTPATVGNIIHGHSRNSVGGPTCLPRKQTSEVERETIRTAFLGGESQGSIARRTGLTQSGISRIIRHYAK